MKSKLMVLAIAATLIVSCQQQEKTENSADAVKETPTAEPSTYAELSIKQGGEWNENVYEGGTEFVNIDQLRVPDQHTDHSYYIRYEGPGWESKQVGYRLYLDWRNAIDIFGKTNDSLVLTGVGQDGFDSYHEMSDWGMDILKVGKSLGIGSIGRIVDNEVHHFQEVDSTLASVSNENDHSSVLINYHGWLTPGAKIDLSSNLSIKGETRLTTHKIQSSEAIEGLCTGIVIHEGTNNLSNADTDGEWAFIATYGEQTLVPDQLGMAIFYRKSDVAEVKDGEFDHLIIFHPTTEPVTYMFMGAWEKEENGIKSEEEFINYLNNKVQELNSNENS